MPGFDNNVVYANNVDFTGNSTVTGQVTSDGELLIGSSVAPFIRVGSLTSSDGSITFTPGNGTLSLQAISTPLTFKTDGANATPSANQIRILGGLGITTAGSGNTVTITSTITAGTITGDSGGALSQTAGNWNILGSTTAPGTSPVVTSGSGSTLTINVQRSQAIAGADSTKVGLSNFSSTDFAVAATGFVTLSTTGAAKTITGDSGGALSPTANNWNLLGSGSITTSGSGSTLTTQLTGLTNHALLVGAGTTTITKLAIGSTGQVLQANTAADPTWSTATFPSTATGTGTLLRADGTNWVATTSTYPNTNAVSTLLYASSANVMAALATANNGLLVTSSGGVPSILAGPGTTGNILQSNAAAAPSFSTATYPSVATGTGTILRANGTNWVATTATYPATTTVSQILYSSSTNVVGEITTANDGLLITSHTGVPSILAGPGATGKILQSNSILPPSYSTATYPSVGTSTGSHLRADGTNWVASSNTFPDTNAQGDILYGSASNVWSSLAKDTNSTRVLTNTGSSNNPAWAQVTLTTGVTGTLPVANGGTSLATLTAHALYVGNGTSAPTALAVGTTGQVLQGNTGADPSWGSPSGGFTWTEVTGTSQNAAVANGYICNNAGLVTVTLPANFAVGDIVSIVGSGAGLWRLTANTGDTIQFGNQATSSAGSLTATNRYDCVEVIGITANTTWVVRGISQGNLTVA